MRISVAKLTEKIGEGKITDRRILAYRCWYLRRPFLGSAHTHCHSLFRRCTPFTLSAGTQFPFGSIAARDHSLLSGLKSLTWEQSKAKGQLWQRNEVYQVWVHCWQHWCTASTRTRAHSCVFCPHRPCGKTWPC